MAAGFGTAAALALVLIGSPSHAESTAAPDSPLIVAAPEAHLTFTRSNVITIPAPTPDQKLHLVLASTAATPDPSTLKSALAAPLTALTPSSPFGERDSPINGAGEFHRGLDFSSPCGTDVFAAAEGKVVFSGWHPYGGGNRVEVEHGNGLKTTYNHLASSSVQVGEQVARGAMIASVGTTGSSTGCHLHFEVYLDGDVVDPAPWL